MTILNFNSKNNPYIWLDYTDYANRLFNHDNQNIWINPVTFLSVLSQGQSLLRSDIISLSLLPFYLNWLNEYPEELDALKGKKMKIIFKKILSLDPPKQNIQEVLKGIGHSYKDIQPIVLMIPSPQLWLIEAAKLTDNDLTAFDENLVDAASMYLADFLRNFSEAGLSAVVIQEAAEPILPFDAVEVLYQPIINVARHYQWEIGYWEKNSEVKNSFTNFYLSPKNQTQLENSVFLLNDSWWSDTSDNSFILEKDIVFGRIPNDAVPELVLTKLKDIRMTAKSS
jgi:hypothetical protein